MGDQLLIYLLLYEDKIYDYLYLSASHYYPFMGK
jgi:hypothetical protein